MKHIPSEPNPSLILRTKIDPNADRIEHNIYRLRIWVSIHNQSDIPVESPLILFPKFGLDIRPLPVMVIESTTSGPHKILACKARNYLQIAPKGKLEACTILTTYNHETERFAFTPNNYHRAGEEMGNLNVLCATGAANFPLRQAQVSVLASDLKSAANLFLKNLGSAPSLDIADSQTPAPVTVAPEMSAPGN